MNQYISSRLIWENLIDCIQTLRGQERVRKLNLIATIIKLFTLNLLPKVQIGNKGELYKPTCDIDFTEFNPFKVASRYTDEEIKVYQRRYPNSFPLGVPDD
jgi:hypothetical protein